MIVSTVITMHLSDAREQQGVTVSVLLAPDDNPKEVRTLTAKTMRIGSDGTERSQTACLEEAFAEILKQAVT